MQNVEILPPSRVTKQPPFVGFDWENGRVGRPLFFKGQTHLMSYGGSGSGKSTSLVVPNLMTLRRSMIVMDPKGQLAAITGRRRREMGRVIIVNPFRVLTERLPHLKSEGWNPLAQLDDKSDDFPSDARKIAEAMGSGGAGGGKDEYFETSQENLLRAFIMWERITQGARGGSLRAVREALAGSSSDLLVNLKAMSKSDNYALRIAGGRAYARFTDQNSQSTSLQDVIDTALKNTAFLDDNRIGADMARGSAIPFGDMHKEIITVFVILPVSQMRDQAKWLRMFVNVAIAKLLNAAPEVATLPPVLFMLDEFGNLGRLPEILNVLNIARDLRIQLWMFLQNLDQLKKKNYADEWTYFFSAAGAKTTFATGDSETAGEWSRMLGKTEEERTSYNKGGGHLLTGYLDPRRVSFSETTATQIFDLFRPEDLARIGRGAMIGFIEPCRFPVQCYAPGYWQKEFYAGMFDAAALDPNPYFLN